MRRILQLLAASLAVAAGWWLAGPRGGPQVAGDAAAVSLLERGVAELENERTRDAESTFADLARRAPRDPAGPANRALALARLGRFDEAFAEAGEAVRRAPEAPELAVLRADLLAAAGRTDEAIAELGRAAAADPDNPSIHLRRLEQATRSGDRELARNALDRLVALRPESLAVLVERARMATVDGDRVTATGAVLRLREILEATGADGGPVDAALNGALEGLEAGDADAARIGVARLANVLRGSPLAQAGLRELVSGTLGDPIVRLRGGRRPPGFGPPRQVHWRATALGGAPGGAIVAGDFDGDDQDDLARAIATEGGAIEVRRGADLAAASVLPLGFLPSGLLTVDLDDDGAWDLVAWGEEGSALLRGDGRGGFEDATATWGLGGGARAVAALDFDLDGDLDLALFGGDFREGALLRSSLVPPLVAARALPSLDATGARAVRATDHDDDGDPDLLLTGDDGTRLLDNLRQGQFALRGPAAGLDGAPAAAAVAGGDFDGDGRFDLALGASSGLALFTGTGSGYRAAKASEPAPVCRSLAALDSDLDGRLDLVCGGAGGAVLLQTLEPSAMRSLELPAPGEVVGLVGADLDGDGDVDLALSGPDGLARLENLDGDRSQWLAVRLAGLAEGNGKNNRHGLGALVEVTAGGAVQRREVEAPVTRFGLGDLDRAERLRVVWTNGVPQNRLDVAADQLVVEEQVLKGSCPFLYAWNGERVEFVTDLLWNAPLGLPLAPGVWAPADPQELVRVDGARPAADGRYRLTITEELWEAAYFDHVRLWLVDHPESVEVASTLKVIPGATVEDRVAASRALRSLAAARDGAGRDVTARLARRDEVYADGFARLRYQGAARPWTLELDLGEAPAAPVRLHLDAWIFPADASLNLAISQRPDLSPLPPRLEMETAQGWRTLVESMGFPAGKTKTMVVDTPALPPGVHRLRVVTSLWLGFDRVAWTTAPDDAAAHVVAKLDPAVARLGFGGFSAVVRSAPNGPHRPDYARRTPVSPWLPFAGRYTRYGDVRELLLAPDDRSVILASGDEMTLAFDASALPAPAPGEVRTVFLESHGWDKDADRNTWRAESAEPLPFRAMRGYPDPSGASFPDGERHRAYVRDWLTRVVAAPAR